MPRPGFSLSAMAASGQPLFCLAPVLAPAGGVARARARRRSAAGRGGGVAGGALPRALVSRGVCSFLAPICVTSELENGAVAGEWILLLSAPRARVAGGADAQ